MRELMQVELDEVVGGNQAEGAGAMIATVGVAVMIVSAPVAVPLAGVVVMGVVCGLAIGLAMDN